MTGLPTEPICTVASLPPPPPGRRGWPWTEAPPPLPQTLPDAREWPKIGIVTPSYQQGRYLEETIRSVLLQGYPALEYYIEDGGSSDESIEIIRKYERFLSGWVSEKDRGQSHAINKGMARLRHARWANWLNSDDILMPGALAAIGRAASQEADAVLLIGHGRHRVEPSGREEPYERLCDPTPETVRNWKRGFFLQPAAMFRKDSFHTVGGLTESLHLAMDFELWVKLGEIGRFACIANFVACDRDHLDAKTHSGMGAYFGEVAQILFDRGYANEARQMIADLYDESIYVGRFIMPLTRNWFYRTLIRPLIRRKYGPGFLPK